MKDVVLISQYALIADKPTDRTSKINSRSIPEKAGSTSLDQRLLHWNGLLPISCCAGSPGLVAEALRNTQEVSREALVESLREILRAAHGFNRMDVLEAAAAGTEELILRL